MSQTPNSERWYSMNPLNGLAGMSPEPPHRGHNPACCTSQQPPQLPGHIISADLPRSSSDNVHPPYSPAPITSKVVSSAEDAFLRMADSITGLVTRLAERDQYREAPRPRWDLPKRRVPYQFAGQDHEDPQWFLKKMNAFIQDLGITDDIEKINLFGDQLTGSARIWFQEHLHLTANYRELERRFLERYDSPEEIAHVLAKLYGEQQGTKESAATFLQRKRRMFDRLVPTTPFAITSSIMIDQLEWELRSRLRTSQFTSYEELIRTVSKIEEDIRGPRKTISTHKTYEHVVDQQQTRQVEINPIPTPRMTFRSQSVDNTTATPPRRSTGYSTGISQRQTRPPSACKFCGQWHFHSQCPQNPHRSGNGPRADRNSGDARPARLQPMSQSLSNRPNINNEINLFQQQETLQETSLSSSTE